ncbi:unnamed protein product [Ambrosiozyma monospora]|uniref:Unnamed protein product n=1 Tax=Ambrosiozyma monospora TaxID=43982 RepID=A0ACB5TJ10_AMBMO|nr:unnamed protein product [Ambrosiozyma monospora]
MMPYLDLEHSPMILEKNHGYLSTPIELLCLVLMRLGSMAEMHLIRLLFVRKGVSQLSKMSNDTAAYLVNRFESLLFYSRRLFQPDRLELYNKCVLNKVGKLNVTFRQRGREIFQDVVGFIDGSIVIVRRPHTLAAQREYYNGNKKKHCVNFHAVVMPDGLAISLSCILPGTYHDSKVYRQSGLEEIMDNHFQRDVGHWRLLGDKGYAGPDTNYIESPAKVTKRQTTRERRNKKFDAQVIAKIRITNEWFFHHLHSNFPYMKTGRLQINSQNVPHIIFCSVFFSNIKTCLHPPQGSKYF